MRVSSKAIALLALAIVAVALVTNAAATPIKEGTTNYFEPWNGGFLQGEIQWAVFQGASSYQTDTGLDPPGSGDDDNDYFYVYQIYNFDEFQSDSVVAYFSILGLDETNVSYQGSEDSPSLFDAQPSTQYLDDIEGAVWKWSSGNGYVLQDGYSWLLILRSEYGPVERDYVLKGPDEGDPLEGPDDVPEPTMIALLGAGGVYLFRRKRRK